MLFAAQESKTLRTARRRQASPSMQALLPEDSQGVDLNKRTALRQARAYAGEMTPHGILIIQMAELLRKKPRAPRHNPMTCGLCRPIK